MRWLIPAIFFLTPLSGHAGDVWHTFTDVMGRKLEAKVLRVESDLAIVEIKSNGKQVPLEFNRLSAQDVKFLEDYEVPEDPAENLPSTSTTKDKERPDHEELPDGVPEAGRLYPRTKEEIRSGIREIDGRKKPEGISRDVFDATKQLNIYRFLCGVPANVEPDAGLSTSAEDAAIACQKNGGLSHELGHSTNRCNLSTGGSMEKSVGQYIEDSGDNNREKRGHRAWCLNPPMKRVGFGSAGGSYSAMWCMNTEGRSIDGLWTYPGKGFFPLEYLHGNAWSVYGVGRSDPSEKIKVEMFRLSKRPDAPFSATEEIPGREIKINHVSSAMHKGINFEPDDAAKRGAYWIRVHVGDTCEGYLVELY